MRNSISFNNNDIAFQDELVPIVSSSVAYGQSIRQKIPFIVNNNSKGKIIHILAWRLGIKFFVKGCKKLLFPFNLSESDLTYALERLIQRFSPLHSGVIELIAINNTSDFSSTSALDVRIILKSESEKTPKPDKKLKIAISPYTRSRVLRDLTNDTTLAAYSALLFMSFQAVKATGYDDALLLHADGLISGLTGGCLVLRRKNSLACSRYPDILTYHIIKTVTSYSNSLKWNYKPITLDDLGEAEEILRLNFNLKTNVVTHIQGLGSQNSGTSHFLEDFISQELIKQSINHNSTHSIILKKNE